MPGGYSRVHCSPCNSKWPNIGSGYETLAGNLIQFGELGLLQRMLQCDRLDEGEGIEAALVAHKSVYHKKKCMLRFNTTKLHRAQKRSAGGNSSGEGNGMPRKHS